MSADSTERRKRIGAAIQADGPGLDDGTESILTGWVVVAEWMDEKGGRWLSKNTGDAAGDTLTKWGMNGFLHEALHEDWGDPVDDG